MSRQILVVEGGITTGSKRVTPDENSLLNPSAGGVQVGALNDGDGSSNSLSILRTATDDILV